MSIGRHRWPDIVTQTRSTRLFIRFPDMTTWYRKRGLWPNRKVSCQRPSVLQGLHPGKWGDHSGLFVSQCFRTRASASKCSRARTCVSVWKCPTGVSLA